MHSLPRNPDDPRTIFSDDDDDLGTDAVKVAFRHVMDELWEAATAEKQDDKPRINFETIFVNATDRMLVQKVCLECRWPDGHLHPIKREFLAQGRHLATVEMITRATRLVYQVIRQMASEALLGVNGAPTAQDPLTEELDARVQRFLEQNPSAPAPAENAAPANNAGGARVAPPTVLAIMRQQLLEKAKSITAWECSTASMDGGGVALLWFGHHKLQGGKPERFAWLNLGDDGELTAGTQDEVCAEAGTCKIGDLSSILEKIRAFLAQEPPVPTQEPSAAQEPAPAAPAQPTPPAGFRACSGCPDTADCRANNWVCASSPTGRFQGEPSQEG